MPATGRSHHSRVASLARIMDGALTFLDNVAARGRGNLRCSHSRPPYASKLLWLGAQGCSASPGGRIGIRQNVLVTAHSTAHR